jgi:hypothetical protein
MWVTSNADRAVMAIQRQAVDDADSIAASEYAHEILYVLDELDESRRDDFVQLSKQLGDYMGHHALSELQFCTLTLGRTRALKLPCIPPGTSKDLLEEFFSSNVLRRRNRY